LPWVLFLLVCVGSFLTGLFLLSSFVVSFLLVIVGRGLTGFNTAGFLWFAVFEVIVASGFIVGIACFMVEFIVSFTFVVEDRVSIFLVYIDGIVIGALFSSVQQKKQGASKIIMYNDFILSVDFYLKVTSSRMVAFLGASSKPGLEV
jgi:hypothetical protein